jgi:hypothetical protein
MNSFYTIDAGLSNEVGVAIGLEHRLGVLEGSRVELPA